MQKDFITATPDSGGSGSTTVTVAASANQTESTRSTSLSVAGGGMTRTVAASQAAGVVTWNYYFSVTPTSLSFVADGGSKIGNGDIVPKESYKRSRDIDPGKCELDTDCFGHRFLSKRFERHGSSEQCDDVAKRNCHLYSSHEW